MKVDELSASEPQLRRQAFRELLKPRLLKPLALSPPPLKISKPQPTSTARAASAAAAAKLVSARQSMNTETQRLRDQRVSLNADPREEVRGRVLDLIVRELEVAFSAPPRKTVRADAIAPADSSRHPPTPSKSESRAQSVADLIEHIDVLVRSQRPTLTFSMNNSFAARVEVEKTGPKQVALRIQGWSGPPPAAELARIREGLRARGLQLVSLSVG